MMAHYAHAKHVADYRSGGFWRDVRFSEMFANELSNDPQRIVVIDGKRSLTIADLDDQARRLAGWLMTQGVGIGDTVSFQLPNWWEVFVIDTAACLIGAIANPIVPIYRDAEVEFILREAKTKVFFAPASFRNFRYEEMIERIAPRLPELRCAVSVRGTGPASFDAIMANAFPLAKPAGDVSPDAPRLLLFTSGTTGRAKGVLHSHNTLDCEIRNASREWALCAGDVILMPSPLTHITGYLYGMCFAESIGMTTILMDRWEADEAISLIERHQVCAMVAATPFLQELVKAARARGTRLPSLRIFPCGGAPIAPETVSDATQAFERCAVFRVYGCTEVPTVTLGDVERGSPNAAETEGYVVGNCVQLVDEQECIVAAGAIGEILVRGPEMMLSYLRDEDNADAFDAEGFFRTGDLGRLSTDGVLTIVGRKKDLIIRGGENISPKEIEDILLSHPAVSEAAVVAMPHHRLGETACAFIVLEGETEGAKEMLVQYLKGAGLAWQKLPERFEFRQIMPKTAAGKIQKYLLRDEIKALLAAEAAGIERG